jgi:hypothetical protein
MIARRGTSSIVVTSIRWAGFALGVSLLALAGGRSIYYPFWAAQASHRQLGRSWGGPSPFGATAVHWLVALPIVVIGIVFILRFHPQRHRST